MRRAVLLAVGCSVDPPDMKFGERLVEPGEDGSVEVQPTVDGGAGGALVAGVGGAGGFGGGFVDAGVDASACVMCRP